MNHFDFPTKLKSSLFVKCMPIKFIIAVEMCTNSLFFYIEKMWMCPFIKSAILSPKYFTYLLMNGNSSFNIC